ncbi:MAG: LysR family transcriptional regulator [Romboutsia sp.]|uniref:LysR family transcriptional regulator n=1 Tax=Romboutsia sp. TaxID=1965302 RepID=UPI003F2FFBA9
MKLEQINYILEIVKHGSINKASKSLLISQPNLSFSLKSLEDELGFKIFNRTSKGIELTRKGSLFLEHAKSIKNSYDSINFLSNDNDTFTDNVLDLYISVQYISSSLYSLIDFYKANSNRNVNLKINQTNISQIISYVSSGVSDIGFISIEKSQQTLIYNILESNRLEFIPLSTTKLYAYMLDNHPLANKDSVNISDLINYPLITLNFTSKDFLYSSLLLSIGFDKFRQKLEVNDYFSLMFTLNELNGITFTVKFPNLNPMPRMKSFNGVFKEINIEDDIIFEFGYIKIANTILSASVSEFVNIFKDNICSI